MTTIEPFVARTGRAGGPRRGPTLPFVAAVGSPYDEWSTVALPVVALPVAAPAVLDAGTVSLATVPAPRSGAGPRCTPALTAPFLD